jgi:hypothetical protein
MIFITNPVGSFKVFSLALNATEIRRKVFENIIDRCLIGSKYEPHKDKAHRAMQAILFGTGCFIWYKLDIVKAHATLITLGLTAKLICIGYKRFGVKELRPLNLDEQAVYKDIMNIVASYSSSIRDVIMMKVVGCPIDLKSIAEAITHSNNDEMKEFAQALKTAHVTDMTLFRQLVQSFFSFASIESQKRLYFYFNFIEDLDYPTDAGLGRDLLEALPNDIKELSLFPYAREQDWQLVIERCQQIQRFVIQP